MRNKTTLTLLFSSFLFLWGCGDEKTPELPKEEFVKPSLFTLLSPTETGINFQNTLTEGLNTNILMYEYFYNGGGVAAGDLNGDGLIDLYFSSNMAENKLYLNEGNLKFRDITQESNTGGRPGPWKTGVTFADVNGDDKLDIFLAYSGALPEPKRANQLFINQGNDENNNPIFKDQAEEWGLNSPAFSNQAYFFDYDQDGDLDMLLLNHNPKSLPVLNEVSTKQFMAQDDPLRGVRLFKQTNGKFTDVTTKSGIVGSGLSYGLGIGITDVNNDGWPDFYVSNDYTIPDYLYINQKNGTFINKLAESIGHNSHFSMGNDVADINNDGWQDIITLDMLPEDNRRQKLLMSPDNYAKFDLNIRSGFHYQYMRNMYQLNNGDGSFSEIGQLAGVSNTDWSWAALLADYDNDGWKDLFITNGYFRDYTNLDFIKYMNDFTRAKGRLQREDVLEIINHMPSSDVKNYMYVNENGQNFSDQTNDWGFSHTANSNGAAYADLDNDGDLELIINNINKPAFIYRNETSREKNNHYLKVILKGDGLNTQGIGARVTIISDGEKQSIEQYNSRGYLSAVSPVLHFGLGEKTMIDSLIVNWGERKRQILTNVEPDQEIELSEADAGRYRPEKRPITPIFSEITPPFSHENPKIQINDFDRQPLLIQGLSYSGPCMAKGDVNGDGKEDVFIGGSINQSGILFLQTGNQRFKPVTSLAFDSDKNSEDAEAIFLDANMDGNLDLYVASGGYHLYAPTDPLLQDRLYLGDGKGGFVKSEDALPAMTISKGAVAVHDVNGDGAPDIFVGGRVIPGVFPEAPPSYLLMNDGQGNFKDQLEKYAPALKNWGMITDAVWVDLNQDESKELVIAGDWLPLSIFSFENGEFVNKTNEYLGKEYRGWWNKIVVDDINGDGKPDLLAGNLGTNTQFKVSDSQPGELYYKDFDQNGAVDPIFCYYIQGKSYPYITRDELLRQLAVFRQKYNTYESYANVTINELFSSEELETAKKLTINHMETTFFLSTSNGKLEKASLPVQVQYSPVYTISVFDFDEDGIKDVLLCGNNNNAKLRLGKFDANYGMLLKGEGKGEFTYINQRKSGLQIKGDVRSVKRVGDTFIFGRNGEPVVAYKLN